MSNGGWPSIGFRRCRVERQPEKDPIFVRAEAFKTALWIVGGTVLGAVAFGIAALIAWWRG